MHSVYLRLALYVLSTLLGMIPAAWAGWVVYDPDSYRLVIDLQAVVVAIFAGSGISLGILRRWGVRYVKIGVRSLFYAFLLGAS